MYFVNARRLNDSNGVPLTDFAIANGATTITEAVKVDKNVGFFTLLGVENKSGGAGTVGIYPEYSIDGTNFYRANTTSGGTLTQESNVVTALANASKWIVFTARLANYVRFQIVAGAASQVTLDFIFQEDYQ